MLIIFAVSNNFCNDIPVEDMKRFEKELIVFARYNHADLLDELKTTNNFGKELQAKVAEVVKEFKTSFVPGKNE